MLTLCASVVALVPPVMRFNDIKSGRPIVLIGCMHNNPASIRLVEDVIGEAAAAEELGAVAIESCQTRWERTQQLQPAGSFLRWALDNEFQAAADVAIASDSGLALADEAIEVTGARLAQLGKQTIVELASPANGGWQRLWRDIASGWAALQDDDGVSARDFVAPELVAGAPVAWLRYFLGSPAFVALLVGVWALLSALVGVSADTLAQSPPLTPRELAPAVVVAALETVVLTRVMLVGLIEERNYTLARHIRATSMQVLTPPRAVRQRGRGKDGRAVVAVLGLAHLNGVRRLLTTSRAV
jgi:hypothetical protein